jgi:NAD(P)-dependent dehydrogenase (short-subunit alcohol dehydrogenase family)
MSDSAAPVLLIAGGSGSIGAEIAAQAAASGWAVALHGRRRDALDSALAAAEARAPNSVRSAHQFDFDQSDAVEALVAEVAAHHGRIDAVIDCTTGGPGGIAGFFADTTPAAYGAFAAQSVVVFQRLAHAALPWLSVRGGTLIAFVSDAGVFAAPRQTMIGAMRAATIGFVRNLAVEVARQGVRVHAVSPSYVDGTAISRRLEAASSERMAAARTRAGLGLPTPADIAPLALFLCGPGAAKITGQVVSVNGGVNA